MACEKKIVMEVSGWLRVYEDGSVDRTWTTPPEVKFMGEPVPPHDHFVNGVATRDIHVKSEPNLRLRIYLPEPKTHDSPKLPILLHFHGGGFCIGQPDWFMYYNIYSKLANTARAIVVSVYLRLAPEHRLPAAYDDCYSALLWLRSVARCESPEPWLVSHANFDLVFLIGDGSGGNLVHEVAVSAGKMDVSPVRVAGAVMIHPGFVRPERSKSEMELPESPFLTLGMVDKFSSLALPEGSTKEHPIMCPMGKLAPAVAGLRLPPVLLCVAEMDVIKDTEMEYYEALRKAEKEVELFVSVGMNHAFHLNKVRMDGDPRTAEETEKLISAIKEFINKH